MILLLIVSKCPCPYANRISEACRTNVVHKSMFLRSTTKPLILWALTINHIFETCRIHVVNKSMVYGQQQNRQLLISGPKFDHTLFLFYEGVIARPSKLIVKNSSPQGVLFIWGVNCEGVDRTNHRFCLMRV